VTNLTNVPTIAALASLVPNAGTTVFVNQDGREGLFECAAGNPPAADPQRGLWVPSNTSGFYWARLWDGAYAKVEWFGAAGNGSIDDYAALSAADIVANGKKASLLLTATYAIGSSLSFVSKIILQGGVLRPANGISVTLGEIDAPLKKVFDTSAGGTIGFDWGKQSHGYPEWWGAVCTNDDQSFASVNRVAINAAISVLKNVELQAGDYFVDGTIIMDHSFSRLCGAGSAYEDPVRGCTRLWSVEGANTVLQVGPAIFAGSVNAMPRSLHIEDINVGRTVSPVISSNAPIVDFRYCQNSGYKNVVAGNGMIGFRYHGTVKLIGEFGDAVRQGAGSGPGTDAFLGHFVDGSARIGLAGGNASLNINFGGSSCGLYNSSGIYLSGSFTDTFVRDFETVGCGVPIFIVGNRGQSADQIGTNRDVTFTAPVLDQFLDTGIRVLALNKGGSVIIKDAYIAPAVSAGSDVFVQNCAGSVDLNGGHWLGKFDTWAVQIGGSQQTQVRGVQIKECGKRVIDVLDSEGCRLEPCISTHTPGSTSNEAAIVIRGASKNNRVAPQIGGQTSQWNIGVDIQGSSPSNNEVDCTMIQPSAIAGGAGNKVFINGVAVTSTGVASNGNFVTGALG